MIRNFASLMIKPPQYRGILRKYARSSGWVLCVGAGISSGIFPKWDDLARMIVAKTNVKKATNVLGLVQELGPEAVIQAGINVKVRAGIRAVQRLLAEILYKNLKTAAGPEWKDVVDALTAHQPSSLTADRWKKLNKLAGKFKEASVLGIADAVVDVACTESRPEAIISFNADPLLYALINCRFALRKPMTAQRPHLKPLTPIWDELGRQDRALIPYYYLHGRIPIPGARKEFNQAATRGPLVFTEGQYHALARTVSCWQANTFLENCVNHRCVFIGLSFSDPNLRRWLTWDYEGKTVQRAKMRIRGRRPSHYWFNLRCPRSGQRMADRLTSEEQLIQATVASLGVRVVWLNDWSEVGQTLESMLKKE